MILPTTYFGNIRYFTELCSSPEAIISHGEFYKKQTYRNRCTILTANGPQDLSVPVERSFDSQTPVSDIKISYAQNWMKDHLGALRSAYANSPYFEYYVDDISKILLARPEKLVSLNQQLLEFLVGKLGLSNSIIFSDESVVINDSSETLIDPGKRAEFEQPPHRQVFGDRWGFQKNLCVVDLLFNEGPEAINYLKSD